MEHISNSVSGEAKELPVDLDLNVEKVGQLSFPLSEHQVQDLIKVCTQATFGLDGKDIVDTNVRDSYQLDPSQIEIQNPEWNNKLNLLVKRVVKEIGYENPNVTAKLYKILLYKTGSHFVRHRDSEKEKNMFGTLIIQLPSEYTGGCFIAYSHDNKQKTFDFGQSTGKANSMIHFEAHSADVEHEIKSVTSGYRFVLVYSLYSDKEIDFGVKYPRDIQVPDICDGSVKYKKRCAIA